MSGITFSLDAPFFGKRDTQRKPRITLNPPSGGLGYDIDLD
jgi:hypothetical protein